MHAYVTRRDGIDDVTEPNRACDPGFIYNLKLSGPSGVTLCQERLRAFSDEDAVRAGIRRLQRAPIVEVWSHDQLICQLVRRAGLH
jgi:hypothetical protein